MATIKSYTDLEQSKKLAEILQTESADMYYHYNTSVVKNYHEDIPNVIQLDNHFAFFNDDIPCWSFASLLGIASIYCSRLEISLRIDKNYNIFAVSGDFVFRSFDECSKGYDNPIDACVEMIEKLHKDNLL